MHPSPHCPACFGPLEILLVPERPLVPLVPFKKAILSLSPEAVTSVTLDGRWHLLWLRVARWMEKTCVFCQVVTSWVLAMSTSLESTVSLCCLFSILTGAQQLGLITLILPSVCSWAPLYSITHFLMPSPHSWHRKEVSHQCYSLKSFPASSQKDIYIQSWFPPSAGPWSNREWGAVWRVNVLVITGPALSILPASLPLTPSRAPDSSF